MTQATPPERQCAVCGRPFTAVRAEARYCGPTCRSRHARAAHARRHTRHAAEAAVQALIAQTQASDDRADVGALKRLRRLIDEAIQLSDV